MKRLAPLAACLAISLVAVGAPAADPVGPSLALDESSPYEAISGSTLYYSPTGSHSGSFTVTANASAASGILSVAFPVVFGSDGATDTTAPFAQTYSWTSSAAANGLKTVTVTDNDADSAGVDFTVTQDTTPPSGQTVALSGGPNYSTLFVPLVLFNGSDGGAGVDSLSGLVERESAPLAGGTCGSFSGTWTPVTLLAGGDTTVTSGNCYHYRYRVSDNVGNQSALSAVSADARVNAVGPVVTDTAPTEVSGAGDQFWNSATDTLWYRPTATGSFTLNATATDAASGIASVTFPDVSTVLGWTGSTGGVDTTSPYSSPVAYSWSLGANAPGSKQVIATNGTGVTGTDTIGISADSAAPTGQAVALVGGPWFPGSVPLAILSGSDAGAGVDASRFVVERASATVTNGVCGTFGAFAAVTLSGTSDASAAPGNCYRYHVKATDNVGNVSAASAPSADAKTDKTSPTIPALLFTNFVNTAASGKVVYVRPGTNGSFTVTAAASDPESGIASYSFPAVTGFTAVGSGPRRTYTATSVGAGAAGQFSITAANAAGANSGAASFSVVADATAPVLGARCNGSTCRTQPYARTVMLTFSASDVGSGVSTIRWTRDGSEPTVDHGFVYSRAVPLQGITHLKARAFDKAGNPSALVSFTVRSLATRLFVGAPTAVVVKAGARYLQARLSSTRRALVSVTMTGTSLKKPLRWNFVLASGTSMVKLRLPTTIKSGTYRVSWTVRADGRRALKTTRVTLRR